MVIDPTLYPFESRYHDHGKYRQHYIEEGAGDPVVMVHGNPTWSFYFRGLAKELSSDHRIIVPDHVGCGFSDTPGLEEYPYTLERRVDDLEALLDARGVKGRVTLVLHDWGGMIGMAWAHRHPQRVARLVILNTAAFPLPKGKGLPWTLRFARTWLGAWTILRLNLFCAGAARYCVTRAPLAENVRQAYLAPYDTPENRIGVLRFVQDIPLGPEDPSWKTVAAVDAGLSRFQDVPMMICWGGRDFVFDGDFLKGWRVRFPKAEVHEFPDDGHYVLEDAGDKIVPLVRDFVSRHPLGEAVS